MNKKIAQTWLVRVVRDEKFLPKQAQMFDCSEHFMDDCNAGERRRKNKERREVIIVLLFT